MHEMGNHDQPARTTQDRGVFTDGACVVDGWEEAPNVAVMLVLLPSDIGVDFRTIPMALCRVSLETRSSGRTYQGEWHTWSNMAGRRVNSTLGHDE